MQKKQTLFWKFIALAMPVALAVSGCGGGSSSGPSTPSIGGAASFFGVTNTNQLVSFTTSTIGTGTSVGTVGGLQPGEQIVGLDARPATGQLYALTNQSRLYTINKTTATATVVGAPFTPVLSGGAFGFDFNPVVDRARVVGDTSSNFRLNPDTGQNAGTDTNLSYAAGDINAGRTPSVFGVAYTNSSSTTPATTLYGIDTQTDSLVRQGGVDGNPSPNSGVLTTVGALGVDTGNDFLSFDIASNGGAYAVLGGGTIASPGLYIINLGNGAAARLGTFPTGQIIVALAAV